MAAVLHSETYFAYVCDNIDDINVEDNPIVFYVTR